MKFIPISIEANTLDPNAKGLFCKGFAHKLGRLLIARLGQLVPQALGPRTGRGKRGSRHIIYDLGVDVSFRTKHRQPRSVGRSDDLFAHLTFASQRRSFGLVSFQLSIPYSKLLCRPGSKSLADFASHVLIGVTNAFAFVRFRRPCFSYLCSELS
jgi:hypothetical protein